MIEMNSEIKQTIKPSEHFYEFSNLLLAFPCFPLLRWNVFTYSQIFSNLSHETKILCIYFGTISFKTGKTMRLDLIK